MVGPCLLCGHFDYLHVDYSHAAGGRCCVIVAFDELEGARIGRYCLCSGFVGGGGPKKGVSGRVASGSRFPESDGDS